MALPSQTDLLGMDYSFQGQPFVDGVATTTIDLTGMDWAWQAQSFVRNGVGIGGVTILTGVTYMES